MSTSKDKSSADSTKESATEAVTDADSAKKSAKKSKGSRPTKDGKSSTVDKAKVTASDAEPAEDKKKKARRGARPQAVPGINPTWWAPVMCTLMIVGLLWIVAFYLGSNDTQDAKPIPGIGYGNLAIGFGLIMAGFLMTTRWK